MTALPPLSLYIHIPWCVKKCPYCDFNSHAARGSIPEDLYVAALIDDFKNQLPYISGRSLISIFFGGGTPSLFSASAIEKILDGINRLIHIDKKIEITLEANPGTIDQVHFSAYREAGINRLSMGVQTFSDPLLKVLGRIHSSQQALAAIEIAKRAGFDNFNLDIMYALPEQSIEGALKDIEMALDCEPMHFSWYQLTLEPNTLFYHQRPPLPDDETSWAMQEAGQQLLRERGYAQYEVSAYARAEKQCVHNVNYWAFGDYLGIGAGAHSKLTLQDRSVIRFAQVRHPKDYLLAKKRREFVIQPITKPDLVFEFMLNALRLTDGFELDLFPARTGLGIEVIEERLAKAVSYGLLRIEEKRAMPTERGRLFLNDLVEMFLK